MWIRWALCFVGLSACGFEGSEGRLPSAEMDAGVDAPACTPALVDVCALAAPSESFIVSGAKEIDTDLEPSCKTMMQAGGPDLCLLYFDEITIEGTGALSARGSRPLALVAKGIMTVAGTIDVSSKRGAPTPTRGAGSAPSAGCVAGTAPTSANGGGAGGTLGTSGGNGGNGTNSSVGGIAGNELSALSVVRGGCDGQEGGIGTLAPGGAAGPGGGAVYLAAASLIVSGKVLAGGGGGSGGGAYDGGGGGGSGGVIVLQSSATVATGQLIATGGGGGEGSFNLALGANGADATTATPAEGGSAGGAGNGGAGATEEVGVAGSPSGAGGGGGGGGGTGFIVLIGAAPSTQGATIVPPATVRPR